MSYARPWMNLCDQFAPRGLGGMVVTHKKTPACILRCRGRGRVAAESMAARWIEQSLCVSPRCSWRLCPTQKPTLHQQILNFLRPTA